MVGLGGTRKPSFWRLEGLYEDRRDLGGWAVLCVIDNNCALLRASVMTVGVSREGRMGQGLFFRDVVGVKQVGVSC